MEIEMLILFMQRWYKGPFSTVRKPFAENRWSLFAWTPMKLFSRNFFSVFQLSFKSIEILNALKFKALSPSILIKIASNVYLMLLKLDSLIEFGGL